MSDNPGCGMKKIWRNRRLAVGTLLAGAAVAAMLGPVTIGLAEGIGRDTPEPAAMLAQAMPEKKPALKPSAANTFNRLLKKPASAPHASPAEDGIHDPENAGTQLLQWPAEAFQGLPQTNDGNRIDWVKALEDGLIAPRYELANPDAEVFTMDLVIVREVKGSMPDVVYPHLQHTEWLDCTNCHDEIFIPEKGKNQISMAAILLGQKCGVCHGKVAFPITDCRRCHSKPKTDEQLRALGEKSSWLGKGASMKKQ